MKQHEAAMTISTTVRLDDWRKTVTIREAAVPWPMHFDFLELRDGEADAPPTYVNVGFWLGAEWPKLKETEASEVDAAPFAIDVVALQLIAKDFVSYVELARNYLVRDSEGMSGAVARLRGGLNRPWKIDDNFLRWVAADYVAFKKAGLPPGMNIAKKYSAHPPAASKWIKRAQPFIDELEAKQ